MFCSSAVSLRRKYFPFGNCHRRGNALQKTAIAITLLSGYFHPHPPRTPRQWVVAKSTLAPFPPAHLHRASYSKCWALSQSHPPLKKIPTDVDLFDTEATLTESAAMTHITLNKNIQQENARSAWERWYEYVWIMRERGISSWCKKWEEEGDSDFVHTHF